MFLFLYTFLLPNTFFLDYNNTVFVRAGMLYSYICGMQIHESDAKSVLFISYEIVKAFLTITFLLLVFSNWNFQDVSQRFLYDQKRNLNWIRQKTKNFPICPPKKKSPYAPIIKIARFCRHDVKKVSNAKLWLDKAIKCMFYSERRLEIRRIRDIRVWDIESRL